MENSSLFQGMVFIIILKKPKNFGIHMGMWDLFRCLRIMELIDVYLSYNELQFIKLVLSKAQVLENFTIVHRVENESSSLEACIEILKFKRVSQGAQIKYNVASAH